jgi:hypothetical protein
VQRGIEVGALAAFVLGLVVIVLTADSLYRSNGFQRRRYVREMASRKALYWLSAGSGVAAVVAEAIVFAGTAS